MRIYLFIKNCEKRGKIILIKDLPTTDGFKIFWPHFINPRLNQ